MSKTNDTTREILEFLFSKGIYAWRNSVGGIYKDHKYYQLGKPGSSDIFAVIPPRGIFCGIEIKTGKDRISPVQQGFMGNIRSMGGLSIVVKDFKDFEEKFKDIIF